MRPTQLQMYEMARKYIADTNAQFLEMVKDGLTADELGRLIKRKPSLWGRFSNWMDKLPKGTVTQ